MTTSPAFPAAAEPAATRKRLGIGMHSYGAHWSAGRDKHPKAHFHDPLTFLQYAGELGAGGVQVGIGTRDENYTKKLRATAEAAGLYVEGQTSVPRDESDVARFEAELLTARAAGADVIRSAMLGGRRYETFESAQRLLQFADQAWKSLTLAEPVLRKLGLRLAIENHKDWLVGELIGVLKRLGSEHVGVCVDTGNSIALLEDPMAVIEAYAPWAVSTHIKDMAVQEYEDGFLLSEVPFGEGFLDLPKIISTLERAKPKIRWNLEMMTRDPLKVPCLTRKYWVTMEERPAQDLARTLGMVRANAAAKPPMKTTGLSFEEKLKSEDDNVRRCVAYAREKLGL
jgi:sugar phosphate isomerase/epimerase